MAKGKSPGSGGLPMEFYVAFRDLIGEDLVDVFNASLEAGLLPFSQRVFLSVVGVCLPRSPLLAVLGSSWLCFFVVVVFFFCFSVCVFPLFAPPRSPSLAVLRFYWALSWLCLSVFPSCLLYIAFYTVYSL